VRVVIVVIEFKTFAFILGVAEFNKKTVREPAKWAVDEAASYIRQMPGCYAVLKENNLRERLFCSLKNPASTKWG